jgi:hypothetical protein
MRYEPAWGMYCEAERPDRRADVIIDNRAIGSPRFLTGGPAPGLMQVGLLLLVRRARCGAAAWTLQP